MSDLWLTIIGITEDGPDGLPDASLRALARAQIVFGGPRHLALAGVGARGRAWPVPFDMGPLLALRGTPVAALVSGDPFWCGAGGSLAAALAPGEWRALPAPGVLSLAAAQLGWRLEETVTLGLHAAPLSRLRPHLARGCRIIATLRDGDAPAALAQWLVAQAAGAAQLTVLERLGGPAARVRTTPAQGFALDCTAPVAVAIDGADLPRGFGLGTVPGRANALFTDDGQITKSPVRALTLAGLAPRAGELLWDIGGGASQALLQHLWHRLPPGARLVANAVTLETEALLTRWHADHGGRLLRIDIAEAAPLGRMRGWTPARPVTQWSVTCASPE